MTKRTILITGAGSGFGKGAAVELASRGHHVIATTETQAQADSLAAEHPELTTLKLDVTSSVDIAQVPALGIDVLINNAGMGVMAPLASVPMAKIRAIFDVNVFGMVELSQTVIPGMKERGWGRIINMSSVAGFFAAPLGSPYAMTKHAVEAFTKSLRAEMAPYGIDVTKINPGPYETGFNDRMINEIKNYTAAGDASAAETADTLRDTVLTNQLDPTEIVMTLADLAEAETTPMETILPEGILEALQALLDA